MVNCCYCEAHYDTKRFPKVTHVLRATTRKALSLKGDVTYTQRQEIQMNGYQRPLVCPLGTQNIKTNLFDSKGISGNFKNDVKMTSLKAELGAI